MRVHASGLSSAQLRRAGNRIEVDHSRSCCAVKRWPVHCWTRGTASAGLRCAAPAAEWNRRDRRGECPQAALGRPAVACADDLCEWVRQPEARTQLLRIRPSAFKSADAELGAQDRRRGERHCCRIYDSAHSCLRRTRVPRATVSTQPCRGQSAPATAVWRLCSSQRSPCP